MNLRKAFAAIAASAGVCGVLGGVLGYLIGRFAPSAYRGLFFWGNAPQFSPTEFGAGIGIAQGLLVGVGIGVVVVALVTWYEVRSTPPKERQAEDG